jgi:hypothetical protein
MVCLGRGHHGHPLIVDAVAASVGPDEGHSDADHHGPGHLGRDRQFPAAGRDCQWAKVHGCRSETDGAAVMQAVREPLAQPQPDEMQKADSQMTVAVLVCSPEVAVTASMV